MKLLDYAEQQIKSVIKSIEYEYEDRERNMRPPLSATEAGIRQDYLRGRTAPYYAMLGEIACLRSEPQVIAVKNYTFPADLRHPRIFVGSILQDCVLYEALADLAAEGKHTVEVTVAVRGLK